ncbi:hypothetical protein CEXT_508971 [Caerostris extrusa]|uniref:Uncharacterized protein n=1 Tax=Caerostris extrusa TaxID=172846 RepID=A0AAV4QWX5_CAEEX|nr:hypothetical protein CEXT_508971 [Caerostris extrusa]
MGRKICVFAENCHTTKKPQPIYGSSEAHILNCTRKLQHDAIRQMENKSKKIFLGKNFEKNLDLIENRFVIFLNHKETEPIYGSSEAHILNCTRKLPHDATRQMENKSVKIFWRGKVRKGLKSEDDFRYKMKIYTRLNLNKETAPSRR